MMYTDKSRIRHWLFPELDYFIPKGSTDLAPSDAYIGHESTTISSQNYIDKRTLNKLRTNTRKSRRRGEPKQMSSKVDFSLNYKNIYAIYGVRMKLAVFVHSATSILFKKVTLLGSDNPGEKPTDKALSCFFSKHILDECVIIGVDFSKSCVLNIATRGSVILFHNCKFGRNTFIHSAVNYICKNCSGEPKVYNYEMFNEYMRSMGLSNYLCKKIEVKEASLKFLRYDLSHVVGLASEETDFISGMVKGIQAWGEFSFVQKLTVQDGSAKLKLLNTDVKNARATKNRDGVGGFLATQGIMRKTGGMSTSKPTMRIEDMRNTWQANITYAGQYDDIVVFEKGIVAEASLIFSMAERKQAKIIMLRNALINVRALVDSKNCRELVTSKKTIVLLENCTCIRYDVCSMDEHNIFVSNCKDLDIWSIALYGLSQQARLWASVQTALPGMYKEFATYAYLGIGEQNIGEVEKVTDQNRHIWPKVQFPFKTDKKETHHDESRTDKQKS